MGKCNMLFLLVILLLVIICEKFGCYLLNIFSSCLGFVECGISFMGRFFCDLRLSLLMDGCMGTST